jgi:hypothetical protein
MQPSLQRDQRSTAGARKIDEKFSESSASLLHILNPSGAS